MTSRVRVPAVAGRFYPAEAAGLERDVQALLDAEGARPEPALAVMVPHAGYAYSGRIAGATFARVRVPARAVVLCPNHTGVGASRALWASGTWELPGGALEVDVELGERLSIEAGVVDDPRAHLGEHAIEVELPLLRARRADVKLTPVVLGRLSLAGCREVGEGLARAIDEVGRDQVLVVASSDLSHYVSAERAAELDRLALARVEALDPDGLYEVVEREHLSMCGFIPVTVMLVAARALGATRATLVRYGHSGEVTGERSRVVGYAGVVIA